MNRTLASGSFSAFDPRGTTAQGEQLSVSEETALLRGDVLTQTRSHSTGGAAVTARMYLPMARAEVWKGLTDYSRWVKYFPALTHSQVLERSTSLARRGKRQLYQAAGCAFLCFSARVEVYLTAIETLHRRIQFHFERGTFNDFAAELTLDDCEAGTLLTYSVRATPSIPVPSFLLQQVIELAFPDNLRQMRQMLCESAR
ncbi:MAG: SRPBCC family protein [Cyanobacteria bacterium J06639_1]